MVMNKNVFRFSLKSLSKGAKGNVVLMNNNVALFSPNKEPVEE